MASIVWDPDLPQAPLFGWSLQPGVNTIRTEMETGPAKVRRRGTVQPDRMSLPFLMTQAQVQELRAFYRESTKGGTLLFDFPHPLSTEGLVECRFLDPPFSIEQVAGPDAFRVTVALEVLYDGT